MSFSNDKDLRRRNKYEKQKERFKNHRPRYLKDQIRHNSSETRSSLFSKQECLMMAEETVKLTSGEEESEAQKQARVGTISFGDEDLRKLEVKLNNQYDTEFEVELESTLDGFFRLFEEGMRIGLLNFASAKNPGGGFLKGSMAQEESLALSTGLYNCIKDSHLYQINRDDPRNGLYHHSVIYSPGVPVIRDADGDLFEEEDEVKTVDILTVPAVNWGDALKKGVNLREIQQNMIERMDYLLGVAAVKGIEILILGSWGCGVFGGDINFVAREFISLLTGKYEGVFKGICFSTLDEKHQQVFEKQLDKAF